MSQCLRAKKIFFIVVVDASLMLNLVDWHGYWVCEDFVPIMFTGHHMVIELGYWATETKTDSSSSKW